MATNKIQDGVLLSLAVASTVVSGDPVIVGNGIPGVAITSYDSVSGKAVIDTSGVYDLSVQAKNDDGNSAVAIGDRIYIGSTGILSKKVSGKFFGIALETVTTGATATINVKIGGTGRATALYEVVAAGVHTVADSPLDSSELITIDGCLADDIALATLQVNGGSPALTILSAVPAASPEGITVTVDGTFSSGDKIQYALLRKAV